MSRRSARLFFVAAATAAGSALVLAAAFTLGPAVPAGRSSDAIPLIGVDAIQPDRVVQLEVKEMVGLDALANAQRERGHMTLWGPRSRPQGMPVFVVDGGDGVHAFLGVDPRTGCALEDKTGGRARIGEIAFVDVCHGTAYDRFGRPIRGPGMWLLDELVLQVRGGVVYAVPHRVIAGGVASR